MIKHVLQMFKGSGPQLLAVILGTINAIPDGMQYGWSAPAIPILESPESPVDIAKNDIVWIETLYMLGGLAGLPLTVYLVDSIGRKYSVLVSSFIGVIGWTLIGAANQTVYLLVGRFLVGVTADIAFNASPMYIAEIAHQNIRGFLAGIIYLMMLFGVVLIYSIGPYVPIYASSILGASILMLQLIIFPFMPESPYYLLYRNKREEAEKALRRLRTDGDIKAELDEIEQAVERQKSERGRPQDLFLIKSNRKAAIIMLILNGIQHFAGISVIIMNLHSILGAAESLYMEPNHAAVLFAVLMLAAATFSTFIVDKCGRKVLLVLSGVLTSVSLLALGIYFNLKYLKYDLNSWSWIPIVTVMIYATVFKLGIGIIPIVMTAELFPARVKGIGMSFSDGVYVLASVLSVYIYQILADTYGTFVPFYLFTLCTVVATGFIHFNVPETKGKTLDQIQAILKK